MMETQLDSVKQAAIKSRSLQLRVGDMNCLFSSFREQKQNKELALMFWVCGLQNVAKDYLANMMKQVKLVFASHVWRKTENSISEQWKTRQVATGTGTQWCNKCHNDWEYFLTFIDDETTTRWGSTCCTGGPCTTGVVVSVCLSVRLSFTTFSATTWKTAIPTGLSLHWLHFKKVIFV
jgi:hypothetical protein